MADKDLETSGVYDLRRVSFEDTESVEADAETSVTTSATESESYDLSRASFTDVLIGDDTSETERESPAGPHHSATSLDVNKAEFVDIIL